MATEEEKSLTLSCCFSEYLLRSKCQMSQWPTLAQDLSGLPRKVLYSQPLKVPFHSPNSCFETGCHAVSSTNLQTKSCLRLTQKRASRYQTAAMIRNCLLCLGCHQKHVIIRDAMRLRKMHANSQRCSHYGLQLHSRMNECLDLQLYSSICIASNLHTVMD